MRFLDVCYEPYPRTGQSHGLEISRNLQKEGGVAEGGVRGECR